MSHNVPLCSTIAFAVLFSLSPMACAQQGDPHGWLGTETLKTRFGDC